MAGEADQVLHATDEPTVDETKSASGAESDAPASSSSNPAVKKMANMTTPSMSGYWKKSMITEDDHSAYHATGWLGDGLESIVPTVVYPTLDCTTVVCFESHLIASNPTVNQRSMAQVIANSGNLILCICKKYILF
jgi:hypothetical protein